jgi:hypothetical protein
LSSSRMRGSILCSFYLWIPAFAGMTGESLRNPVPELAEGPHGPAFVILAVKFLMHKTILTAKTRRALRSIRHCFSFFAYLASLR